MVGTGIDRASTLAVAARSKPRLLLPSPPLFSPLETYQRRRFRFFSTQQPPANSGGMTLYPKDKRDPEETYPATVKLNMPRNSRLAILRALGANAIACSVKFALFMKSGSSALFAESLHSFADSVTQLFLYFGLLQSEKKPDDIYNYGYGRSAWANSLISATGVFFCGGIATLVHAYSSLHSPELVLDDVSLMGIVLGVSFVVDGYVLHKTLVDVSEKKEEESVGMFAYLREQQDPFTYAVIMEDTAACLGVLVAGSGVYMSYVTGNPLWDCGASALIGVGLCGVGLKLGGFNSSLLMGRSVSPPTLKSIEGIIMSFASINKIHAVQSQYLGPQTFSYKAEVDINGAELYNQSEELRRYRARFGEIYASGTQPPDSDADEWLGRYTEDVTRVLEQEIRRIERAIRRKHPDCLFIELELDSKDTTKRAFDDGAIRMPL